MIEAVPERMEIKQAVFAELDAVTPGHAILASNTSALSITEMAEATMRPDKVVGFHFFYPASMMRLIEVIEGEETSDETLQAATNFAQAIRKTADPLRRGPRLRRQPHPQLGRRPRSGGSTEEEGLDPKEIDKVVQESKARADGPVLPRRHARARHRAARGRAPAASPTATASTCPRR